MRILFVNDYAHVTGGADVHCFDLARALEDAGHEVVLLSTAHPDNLEFGGRFVPLTVSHDNRDGLSGGAALRAAAFAFWNPQAARAAKDLIESFRPDVVHAHKLYPQLSVASLVVAGRRGIPVVQTIHDYEFVSASPSDHSGAWVDRQESKLPYRALNSALLVTRQKVHRPLVGQWITVSSFMAAVCRRSRGIDAHVLPNFTKAPSGPLPSFEARRGVLFAGRLTPEKGVRDLIQVARENQDLEFALAGEGKLAGEVRKAAAELASISFLGSLTPDEVHGHLKRARVLVVPSRWEEPGGLVALEAMAAGTPVVAYEGGGLTEYVRNGGGGIVVKRTPQALSEGIRSLSDPTRWLEISRRGQEAAATIYSPSRYVAEVLGIYRLAQTTVGPELDV